MEIEELNVKTINEFWEWFSDNFQNLSKDFENNELLTELDNQINRLGSFAWEIGPGTKTQYQLVISPGGELNLLNTTKKIISYARAIPNWEFYYAKPPKQWELIFDFQKHNRELIRIDASKWKYILLKYNDGMFEIIIQTHDLQFFDKNDQLNAMEILLDSVLGEEKRMVYFCNIELVEEFEEQYENKGSYITDLNNHIKSLI